MSGACGWSPWRPEQIQDWVDTHQAELPRTLAELIRFPMPFRRVIVNSVSEGQRISFWREHLSSFLGPTSPLSPQQQALVHDAIEQLPLIFGVSRQQFESRVRSLEERMRDLLIREEAGRLFAMIGPPEPPEGLPLPAHVVLPPAV